ncbi:ras-like GTP-binding protein RhoL [Anabrus simplex]|uniref:ras-like GTP-binding protein RhoL n=1 Tax=Anabrus simplex TaxID=316456 RepID=UPI0034DD3523
MRENGVPTEGIQSNRIRPIKITAVGDGMVGKTCLLITYTNKQFPQEYVPTVFDNYADNINVDNQEFNMTLWDTAGQEDYERLRPLCYPNTDCFLLCYSVASRSSYENVVSKWYPEIRHHCPHIPVVLVATKIDLREEDGDALTEADGRMLKKRIKAARYVECSAKNMQGIEEVFIEAIRTVMKKPRPRVQRTCLVL